MFPTRKLATRRFSTTRPASRIRSKNFGIPIQRIKATVGPTVTLYEIVQAQGVKISKIQRLENDIAQSLKALGIRIIAPIPGKGTIGIEVPNRDKQVVSMYSAVRSLRFQESKAELPVVIGRTIQNENYVFDLAKMPHLLVAGATGQGKSVGLNAIITSLLYRKHPAQLKFVMIDPKMVEFSLYAKIERHFLAKMESRTMPSSPIPVRRSMRSIRSARRWTAVWNSVRKPGRAILPSTTRNSPPGGSARSTGTATCLISSWSSTSSPI